MDDEKSWKSSFSFGEHVGFVLELVLSRPVVWSMQIPTDMLDIHQPYCGALATLIYRARINPHLKPANHDSPFMSILHWKQSDNYPITILNWQTGKAVLQWVTRCMRMCWFSVLVRGNLIILVVFHNIGVPQGPKIIKNHQTTWVSSQINEFWVSHFNTSLV